MPHTATGTAGRPGVMSVQVLPSSVLHKRCRRVIVPTQPSVGLLKLMQRSQVSPGTVFWIVNVLKPSSVWTIWPALLIAQPTCGSMKRKSS
jgi:hypothetical protein